MRYCVIVLAVVSVLAGPATQNSYGDVVYGVGTFMGFDAFSGVCRLDTATGTSEMLIHTPDMRWYGATDGPSPDTFYAVGNPSYSPTVGSELYLVNTTSWSVTPLGMVTAPTGGGPIREIAWDETSNTLYGTDYANLYTLPTGGGLTTFVGSFGTDPGTGNLVDYVFSMDYDTSVGQLVGTSWRNTDDQTDLYYFNRTNGTGTLVGYTGFDRFTDVLYSNGSSTLIGTGRPQRVFDVNATTGVATQIATSTGVNFYGLANATPGVPAPSPYATAPLSSETYEASVLASSDAFVGIAGGGTSDVNDIQGDSAPGTTPGTSATINFDVLSTVPGQPPLPWQNTNTDITIGLSDSSSITPDMLMVSSSMTVTATGSDEGVGGVTRHSSVYGTASILGSIKVEAPAGGTPGMDILFGASVYTWGSGIDLLTWTLTIKDNANPATVYLNVNETSDPWNFSFNVLAGQTLDYAFNYDGLLFEAPDGTYTLNAELEFGAAGIIPEPATIFVMAAAGLPMVLKRRHRGK
jgi:hypothetical protein